MKAFIHALKYYCKVLPASFYSSALYAEVVKRWQGLGIGYLLFIIILGAIPLSARVILAFNHFFKEKIVFPIQALPQLTIQDGQVIYNRPMPYLIKNNRGEVVSIIDTTEAVSSMKTYPQLSVLITKNKMDFRPPSYKQFLGLAKNSIGNPIYTRTFDEGVNGLFSGTEWIHSTGLYKLKVLMQIIVFPCVTLFYFVVFGVILFLLSALVQLYSDIFFNLKLSFQASCRLIAVAATPTLLLFFFMRYGNVELPRMGWVYGVLLLSYVSYGVYSTKRLNLI